MMLLNFIKKLVHHHHLSTTPRPQGFILDFSWTAINSKQRLRGPIPQTDQFWLPNSNTISIYHAPQKTRFNNMFKHTPIERFNWHSEMVLSMRNQINLCKFGEVPVGTGRNWKYRNMNTKFRTICLRACSILLDRFVYMKYIERPGRYFNWVHK